MKTNFSTNGVLLTTLNQESFLTFFKEPKDSDASIYITNINMPLDSSVSFYINGININDLKSEKFNSDNTDYYPALNMILNDNTPSASYMIYTNSLFNFDGSITFKYNNTFTTVNIYNRPYIINNKYYDFDNGTSLNDIQTSSMMLRTNPKLTGNVKLVIDSNSKMYLDTFKVSDILANKDYRKKEISSEDYLSNSIRNIFGTLPKGDLYKVSDENYYAFNSHKTFKNQYISTYNYGAKNNDDELYNENFSILAPLWINQNLPDYFLIFRIDGSYENNTNFSSTEIFKKYISKGKLIKSFNLQNDSPIGKFLRNHLKESQIYPASMYMTFNAIDNLSWYGIAVDKGIVTERVETSYFAKKINNQTWANYYITDGFERNNLISSNLINMEFMFDDEDASLYSMNKYFGIYVKKNDFLNGYLLSYYNTNINDYQTSFVKENDIENFNSINDDTINTISQNTYDDRIFCVSGPDNLSRISFEDFKNPAQLDLLQSYINKPYLNILNTPISELNINKKTFITITLNNVLEAGEHLRILGPKVNNSDIVYEIIASNSDILSNEPYVYPYEVLNETQENIKIYRTVFYSNVDEFDDPIAEQIKRIVKAFNEVNINNDYEIVTYNNNTISFINLNTNNNLVFQRINANILNNKISHDNDIIYFGNVEIKATKLKFNNISNNNYLKYMPIDFELWGDRETYIVNFALGSMIGDSNMYHLYAINSDNVNQLETVTLYKSIDNENKIDYQILYNFEISYLNVNDGEFSSVNILKNNVLNFNDLNTTLICTKDYKIYTPNNIFNGYSVYPLAFSLMGYIPIKDFDYTIYDNTNLNLNFIEPGKNLNFVDSYFTDANIQTANTANLYTFVYTDGSIGIDNKGSNKTLLSNKVYMVTSGSGIIQTENGIISISSKDTSIFNTFDINDNKIKYIRANQDSSLTISLLYELDGNKYDNNTLIQSEEYIANVFDISLGINGDNNVTKLANNIFWQNNSSSTPENYDTSIRNVYKKLNIPLVSPVVNKWESIDLNCKGYKSELIWNMSYMIEGTIYPNSNPGDPSIYCYSNFIPYNKEVSQFNNELIFGSYQYMYNDPNKNKYIFNDINNVLNNKTLKEYIINSKDSAPLNTLMYYNNESFVSKFAVGYYNKFTDMFEFTVSGIRFNISINNLSYLQNINFANYNNFLVTFILNPSRNSTSNNPIEFIINENTKSILITWYQGNYDISYNNRNNTVINPIGNIDNSSTLFTINGFKPNSLFQKERFIINFDNLSILNSNKISFPIAVSLNDSYKYELNEDSSVVNLFQFNNNTYYNNSFTKYYNSINDLSKFEYVDNMIITDVNNNLYKGYNTFVTTSNDEQKINYTIKTPFDSYENKTLNYSYNINKSSNTNNSNLELLKYQINSNLIDFYIIRPDSSIYINSYKESIAGLVPININIIDPIKNEFITKNTINDSSIIYYVHNGFYNPKMKIIFSFNFNEDEEIINTTNKNYVLCNTSINNISDIEQMWINKVCYNTKLTNFDNQTVSFDYIKNYNILSSIWDFNYYYNYEYEIDANTGKYLYKLPTFYAGYLTPYEHSSFFGSKCLVIKSKENNGSFNIKTWNYNNINIENDLQNFNNNLNTLKVNKVKINLTQSFIDELLQNNTFVNNWNFINSGITNNLIINYIKESVINYYTINNKNNLIIYYKPYNGNNLIEYNNDGSFIDKIENNTTSITFENNQYYLNIEFPDDKQYTYYFEFKIERKNNNE